MIIPLLKRKPYRGGPLFDQVSSHSFDFNGTLLELRVPASSSVMKEPPRMINFPFNKAGWFNSQCKRSNVRDYVDVFGNVWAYFPPGIERIINLLTMGTNERCGALCFFGQLNRTEKGRTLDLNDPQSLGAYIKWEYDDYYESPEQGPYGKGQNFQIRADCDAKYVKVAHRANDPFWQQQHQAALQNYLEPMPQDFALAPFGGGLWTHFSRKMQVHESWSDYYCLPLSASVYLEIELAFKFETGIEKRNAAIKADMQRTAEWLLQHIKITYPQDAPGPLALPQ
jgi:hypothetical protein